MKKYRIGFFTMIMCVMLLLPGECFAMAASKPAKPVISLSSDEDSSIKITIGATMGADGFRIYIKSDSDTEFRKLTTIKKNGSRERVYVTESLDPGILE